MNSLTFPKKIKTIGTIGPASIPPNILQGLKDRGLDSFRINLSHANHNSLQQYYTTFQSLNIRPSIDTQGAQVRITHLRKKVFDSIGEKLIIGVADIDSDSSQMTVILL